MSIAIKRVYEAPAKADGYRVLVDRLWPRGLKKEALALDEWLKELAPSTALRQWFAHDPSRWDDFCHRYACELDERKALWQPLAERSARHIVTLLYAARDEEHNQALALKVYLERGLRGHASR